MYYHRRLCLVVLALALGACKPEPVVVAPKPAPTPILVFVPKPTPIPEITPEPPIAVATPVPIPEAESPAIVLPPPPPLTTAGMAFLLSTGGHALILEFETGGRSGYDPHPEWPGGASGVTVGIGYDLGYYSKQVIKSDWGVLNTPERDRLAGVAGFTGSKAKEKKNTVKDIFIAWAIATDVFDRVDVAREYSSAKRAIPGFEDLRSNAQAAIISLGFNRGWGMSGSNRVEFRAIRDLVPSRDYEGIALQLKKMKHVWAGTAIQAGMYRRRDAEAKLVMTP